MTLNQSFRISSTFVAGNPSQSKTITRRRWMFWKSCTSTIAGWIYNNISPRNYDVFVNQVSSHPLLLWWCVPIECDVVSGGDGTLLIWVQGSWVQYRGPLTGYICTAEYYCSLRGSSMTAELDVSDNTYLDRCRFRPVPQVVIRILLPTSSSMLN